MDALDGDAPFATIMFLDQSHYQYVAKSCVPDPGSRRDVDDRRGRRRHPARASVDDASVRVGHGDAGAADTDREGRNPSRLLLGQPVLGWRYAHAPDGPEPGIGRRQRLHDRQWPGGRVREDIDMRGAGQGVDAELLSGSVQRAVLHRERGVVLVALAELWVSAQMPYCQAVNGGP